MDQDYEKLQNSLISIASELFRFEHVFAKVLSKIDVDERSKYQSQYSWFAKKVSKALEESNLKLLNCEGQIYDPGMAVTPLNLDDFEPDDTLYVLQTIEPSIIQEGRILKTGTVILGRVEG